MANGHMNNDNGKDKDTLTRSTKDNEMMCAQDGQHPQHGTRCLLPMVMVNKVTILTIFVVSFGKLGERKESVGISDVFCVLVMNFLLRFVVRFDR